MKSQKVCIGLPYIDSLNRRTSAAVQNLLLFSHHRIKVLHQIASLIDRGRNRIVDRFLETKYDWLLFIDSDMFFPDGFNMDGQMNALDSLLKWNKPIVSALCVKRIPPHNPIISDFGDREDWTKASKVILDGYYDGKSSLIKVDAVGAAFLLINREVILKVKNAGKISMTRPSGITREWYEKPFDLLNPMGEDFSFCWRAMEQGYEIWVDTSIPICHIGEKVYTICDFEAYKEVHGLDKTHMAVIESREHADGLEVTDDR